MPRASHHPPEKPLSIFYQIPQVLNCFARCLFFVKNQHCKQSPGCYLFYSIWFLASIPIRDVDVKQLDMDFSSEIFFTKLEQDKWGCSDLWNTPISPSLVCPQKSRGWRLCKSWPEVIYSWSLAGRRLFCMSADDSRDGIIRSGSKELFYFQISSQRLHFHIHQQQMAYLPYTWQFPPFLQKYLVHGGALSWN